MDQPAAKPVKSAKEAINAMYAADSSKRLSNYLASSSQDIKKARSAKATASSATGVHKRKNRLESARPSAASVLQKDKSAQPIVRTSLKLDPKKPPRVMAAKPAPRRAMDTQLRPRKSQTQLAVAAIKKAAADVLPEQVQVSTVKKPTAPATPVAKPAASKSPRLFQDVRRPAPAQQPAAAVKQLNAPQDAAASATLQTIAEHLARSEKKAKNRPLDSIKNRFRPAPKGYAAKNPSEVHFNAATPEQPYLNPDFSAAPSPTPAPEHEAIHLYGMTETPETYTTAPDPIEPTSTPSDDSVFGVIEDYRAPADSDSAAAAPETSSKVTSTAPDNNRYTLGGQSPFFLKTVNVEKRPLSDSPTRRITNSGNSVYAAQNLSEPAQTKNVYTKKSKSSSKPDKSHPTVIIPARRRSHAPLFALLVITVILGAVAGAAIYLFFFQ